VGVGFLLLVSLSVSAGLAAMGRFLGSMLPGLVILSQIINFVVSFSVIGMLFALIYRYLPDLKIPWHDVWIGAALTAGLFEIGKFLIGFYLGNSSISSAYGAASSLAIILVWIYYSAQIFLLGAEFTHVYAKHRESLLALR
jgi:membrane protein